MTISSYMYIILNPKFDEKIKLVYSSTEEVNDVKSIAHGIFREGLKMLGIRNGVEIVTVADAPGKGTGLGSSSSMAVGLVNALSRYRGHTLSKEELAQKACAIEITRLRRPIGKQDQYAAAIGGMNHIKFCEDESVKVTTISMSKRGVEELNNHLVCLYTGITRDADAILSDQKKGTASNWGTLIEMRDQADYGYKLFKRADFESLGKELTRAWSLKKKLAPGITSPDVDKIYEKGIGAGAYGGKLSGAGGGGFFTFLCPKEKQGKLVKTLGLRRINASLDAVGSCVIFPQ